MSHGNVDGWHERMLAVWRPLEQRLDALDRALWDRATRLSGLGAGRNVWHNAMLGLADGRPWRDVDYDALRTAIRIDDAARRRVHALRRALWSKVYDRFRPRALAA